MISLLENIFQIRLFLNEVSTFEDAIKNKEKLGSSALNKLTADEAEKYIDMLLQQGFRFAKREANLATPIQKKKYSIKLDDLINRTDKDHRMFEFELAMGTTEQKKRYIDKLIQKLQPLKGETLTKAEFEVASPSQQKEYKKKISKQYKQDYSANKEVKMQKPTPSWRTAEILKGRVPELDDKESLETEKRQAYFDKKDLEQLKFAIGSLALAKEAKIEKDEQYRGVVLIVPTATREDYSKIGTVLEKEWNYATTVLTDGLLVQHKIKQN